VGNAGPGTRAGWRTQSHDTLHNEPRTVGAAAIVSGVAVEAGVATTPVCVSPSTRPLGAAGIVGYTRAPKLSLVHRIPRSQPRLRDAPRCLRFQWSPNGGLSRAGKRPNTRKGSAGHLAVRAPLRQRDCWRSRPPPGGLQAGVFDFLLRKRIGAATRAAFSTASYAASRSALLE
jgi:hypothetical protein